MNKGTCKPEEGLAILSLILTRCDSLGIVLLAFWVPRELNRVSDYLSHLSVLVRSDVTGTFTADSAEALATAAAGVAADSVEQVMQGAGSRRRPQELNSQAPHRGGISQRVHSGQYPPLSPVRDIGFNVLCPARDAQRGQLPEPRDLFDSSAAGMRLPGSPLALPRRTDPCESPSQSAPAGGPPPLQRKLPLPHHLQQFTALVDHRNPHQLLTLLLLYVGHDGLLRAGEITSGLLTTDVLWAPDRTALSLRFTLSKTCFTDPVFLVQFRDRPTPNAVSLMRVWWDLMGLHHSRTVCLFPKRLSVTRFNLSQSISYDSLVIRVKSAAKNIGLPAEDYSSHSLRAGGATDLFVARVSHYIIQRMGRWASDAALVYYRHEEDVLCAISTAFWYVANPTSGGAPIYREGKVVV